MQIWLNFHAYLFYTSDIQKKNTIKNNYHKLNIARCNNDALIKDNLTNKIRCLIIKQFNVMSIFVSLFLFFVRINLELF